MTATDPVLVVEPYFGGSHRVWAEGIQTHLGRPVELLTLPPRWWKWRMRGGAVTLAEMLADRDVRPGAVVVSDIIDLPAFLSFARPELGDAPVALYFHESQLTYPDSPQMEPDISYAVTNWLSALAADHVFFNSHYHLDVFFAELPRLLRHFPDLTHEHRIGDVRSRSEVLEIGLDLTWASTPTLSRTGPIRVMWNHRWEHDKDPEAFFRAVDEIAGEGLDFEVAVCGESFGNQPAQFKAASRRHGDRIVHLGFAPVEEYRRLLRSSDVVVSTAYQEFFGIAVVEAMAAGCMPLLPNRLAYPELVPAEWHQTCLYPPGELTARLRSAITRPAETRRLGAAIAPTMARFGWDVMAPRYRGAIDAMLASPDDGRGRSRVRG